jgi:hypothetical protein
VSYPCSLSNLFYIERDARVWYMAEWWVLDSYSTGPGIQWGPYRFKFTLRNEHNHSKEFEFNYVPLIEPYCDGTRKGYRIMSPSDHHCCTDDAFWVVMFQVPGSGRGLELAVSARYVSEANAVSSAQHFAANNSDKTYYVMKAIVRTQAASIVTERLRGA